MSAVRQRIERENFLSLDDRLRSARTPAKRNDQGGFEAHLDNLPTQIKTTYGDDVEGRPILVLELRFARDNGEPRAHHSATAKALGSAVDLMIGEKSGRIYEVAFRGSGLLELEPKLLAGGVLRCIHDHVARGSSPHKVVTALATADLLSGVLRDQLQKISFELAKPKQPPKGS